MDLFDAYQKSMLPSDQGFIVSSFFSPSSAYSRYEVVSYNPEKRTSVVDVVIKTGRLHQIRRHFSMIGYPVMGDPRYGRGNKNTRGMMLEAVSLGFTCPFLKKQVEFTVKDTDEPSKEPG